MTAIVRITRAGPLATIQDRGRFGMLTHGVAASGVMDGTGYALAGQMLGAAPVGAIEITMAGLDLCIEAGQCHIGYAGGEFIARHNGERVIWPGALALKAGDIFSVSPGPRGNYGYLRFDGGMDVPQVLGSIATNMRAGLGGLEGRALIAGDRIGLVAATAECSSRQCVAQEGPIRVIWGLHADLFGTVRDRFLAADFTISPQLDRMGVRLNDGSAVFADKSILSLVSDAVVPGDIQILGDGTPIVLMRDHQPTGGYPRIATIISADLDRFAQLRPGSMIAFTSVGVDHAHQLMRSAQV